MPSRVEEHTAHQFTASSKHSRGDWRIATLAESRCNAARNAEVNDKFEEEKNALS